MTAFKQTQTHSTVERQLTQQPSQPSGARLYRRLRHHRVILIALALSVILHISLLLTQPQEHHATTSRVINARLLTQQAHNADAQNQLQQQAHSSQNSHPLTDKKHPPAPPSPADETEKHTMNHTGIEVIKPDGHSSQKTSKKSVNKTDKTPRIKKQKVINPAPENQPLPTQKQQEKKQLEKKKREIKQQKKGKKQQTSDPIKSAYHYKVLAHIRNRLILPRNIQGAVRLELTFNYNQMVTQVQVITSSGNPQTDALVKRAILAANPFPAVPPDIKQPYIFRPTIDLSGTAPQEP